MSSYPTQALSVPKLTPSHLRHLTSCTRPNPSRSLASCTMAHTTLQKARTITTHLRRQAVSYPMSTRLTRRPRVFRRLMGEHTHPETWETSMEAPGSACARRGTRPTSLLALPPRRFSALVRDGERRPLHALPLHPRIRCRRLSHLLPRSASFVVGLILMNRRPPTHPSLSTAMNGSRASRSLCLFIQSQ